MTLWRNTWSGRAHSFCIRLMCNQGGSGPLQPAVRQAVCSLTGAVTLSVTFLRLKGCRQCDAFWQNCWVQLSSACHFVLSAFKMNFWELTGIKSTSQHFCFLEKSLIMWGHNPEVVHWDLYLRNMDYWSRWNFPFLSPLYCVFNWVFQVLCNFGWILDSSLKRFFDENSPL